MCDELPLATFILAHGDERGAEKLLASLSALGDLTLEKFRNQLFTSLDDLRAISDRAVVVEAFFDALERRGNSLSPEATEAAVALTNETITSGFELEKTAALRAAGGFLVELPPAQHNSVIDSMMSRAEDEDAHRQDDLDDREASAARCEERSHRFQSSRYRSTGTSRTRVSPQCTMVPASWIIARVPRTARSTVSWFPRTVFTRIHSPSSLM